MDATLSYQNLSMQDAETFCLDILATEGTGFWTFSDAQGSGIYKPTKLFITKSSFEFVGPNIFNASVEGRSDQTSSILNWKGCYVNNTGSLYGVYSGALTPSEDNTDHPVYLDWYRWSGGHPFDLEYAISVEVAPYVITNEFKNSMVSRHHMGVNTMVWQPLELSFKSLSDEKARSMLLFLETRMGIHRFDFQLPSPFNPITKYYSPSWSHVMVAPNVNDISVTIVPDALSVSCGALHPR
jgi:hypothetical protein